MPALQQDAYLLQNQMNPFPVSGSLVLDDAGTLSFTLDAKAAGAALGWLEKATGDDGLKAKIEAGTPPGAPARAPAVVMAGTSRGSPNRSSR